MTISNSMVIVWLLCGNSAVQAGKMLLRNGELGKWNKIINLN